MSYYQFGRKSVRWWRKVFFWLLEVAVVNSYILYNVHTADRRKLTHEEFRRELVLALFEQLAACESPESSTTGRPESGTTLWLTLPRHCTSPTRLSCVQCAW